MKTISCDHCKAAVPVDGGPRGTGKPPDWVKVTIAGKLDASIPKFTRNYDLCGGCAETVEKFITGGNDEH